MISFESGLQIMEYNKMTNELEKTNNNQIQYKYQTDDHNSININHLILKMVTMEH